MDEERSDYDVLEIDLPAYEEDSFAIPDIPAESSFAENKEEIYRRNRLLAADMQMEVLAAEEETRAAKKAEFEDLYKESAAAVNYNRSMKIIFSVLAVMLAAVIAVLAILFIQMRDSFKNVSVSADAEEVVSSVTVPVVTEVPKKAAVSEKKEVTSAEIKTEEEIIPESVIKTTIVREPYESKDSTMVYNTEIMSYALTPWRTDPSWYPPIERSRYKDKLKVFVTVLNLTDYYYYIVPNFYMKTSDGSIVPAEVTANASYDVANYELDAEELIDGEWVKTGDKCSVYGFNINGGNFLSLTLEFDVRDDYGSLCYDPQYKINHEFSDKVDVGFEIPFEELEKYIKYIK